MVGKRIEIKWKTGPYKGWHPTTIIGYTSNLIKNLIYYDVRDTDVDPTINYYAENLFSKVVEWKFI